MGSHDVTMWSLSSGWRVVTCAIDSRVVGVVISAVGIIVAFYCYAGYDKQGEFSRFGVVVVRLIIRTIREKLPLDRRVGSERVKCFLAATKEALPPEPDHGVDPPGHSASAMLEGFW